MIVSKVNFGNSFIPVSKSGTDNPVKKNNFSHKLNEIDDKKKALGCLAAFILVGTAIATKGKTVVNAVGKFVKSTVNNIKNITKDKNKIVDCNKEFMEEYLWDIDRIKHAFRRNENGEYEKVKDFFPRNGYILVGPKSQAQETMFNKMLKELEKRGVEIVDPGNGGQAHFNEIEEAWEKMWKRPTGLFESSEEFKAIDDELKKTGRLKAFVVRGLDEIGQPKGFREGYYEFPDGYILKDTPDTESSCFRHGVMLMYTCKNIRKVDPATIRGGRIDYLHLPCPNENEPLEIWKEYLKDVKDLYKPQGVEERINEAKNILSKRGKDVMKEMEPHFNYENLETKK